MSTLFVNLFGGPGVGKSTTAAMLFGQLKADGVNAELITEYAKDKTWSEDFHTLQCQPYIVGKQMYRQYRVLDKVDVAVTDSPILLGAIYKGFGCVEGWTDVLIRQFFLFNNLNVFLVRNSDVHPYNAMGRSQTEEEAMRIDREIWALLGDREIPFQVLPITADFEHVRWIRELVVARSAVAR